MVEFIPEPDRYQHKPDVNLTITGETWAELYLSRATPEELIQSGEVGGKGDAEEAARLINLFDRYRPEKAVVIPPAFLDHAH